MTSACPYQEYLPVKIDVTSAFVDAYVSPRNDLAAAWQTLTGFGIEIPAESDLFSYFVCLDAVLVDLDRPGSVELVKAALRHIDCLAERAGCSRAAVLAGAHFVADPAVVRDALVNITEVLRVDLRDREGARAEQGAVVLVSTARVLASLEGTLASARQTLSGFHIPLTPLNSLADYFMSLHQVLAALNASGGTLWAEAVMGHVDYLADKVRSESRTILGGGEFSARQDIVLEALSNIDSVLQRVPPKLLERARESVPADVLGLIVKAEAIRAEWSSREKTLIEARSVLEERQKYFQKAITDIDAVLRMVPGERMEETPQGIPREVFGLILDAEEQLVGWCSRDKAMIIARIVLQERPLVCVEIGIFGGRSLIPCAAALRYLGAGAIYGIEAWTPKVAVENVTNKGNDEWWATVDFASIKREFYRFVAAENLTEQVKVIEAPSNRAAALFDQIDFLHIDGSHSMVNAAEDVILYARKVRSGGTIVFDDVDWQSTAPAHALLASICDTVITLKDPQTGLDVCAVMRRR
jgi:hypothetical protein